jgi:hypothetical protein
MINDASELFAWLRSLSFIESGPAGVFPHDLTREVIEADLRWLAQSAFARFTTMFGVASFASFSTAPRLSGRRLSQT